MRFWRSCGQGVLGVLAGVCVVGATPARALEAGVHVDPGSPAAKEYAIPLSQARQQGSTGSEAALFGAGITPPGRGPGGRTGHGSRGGSGSGGSGASSSGGAAAVGASGGSGSSGTAQPPASVLTGAAAHSSGDSSLLVLIGGGVLILVLGGFGGTVLRHVRPPRSTP